MNNLNELTAAKAKQMSRESNLNFCSRELEKALKAIDHATRRGETKANVSYSYSQPRVVSALKERGFKVERANMVGFIYEISW